MKTLKLLLALSFATGLLIEPVMAAGQRPEEAAAASGAGKATAAGHLVFSTLPDGLWQNTLSFLGSCDLCKLSETSSFCRGVAQDRIENIRKNLMLPEGVVVDDKLREVVAPIFFKKNIAPNDAGKYEVSMFNAIQMLSEATKKHNDQACAQLDALIVAIRQAPFQAAMEEARGLLEGVTTLPEARDIYNELAEDNALNRLKRLALCFAWFEKFAGGSSLDETINLGAIVSEEEPEEDDEEGFSTTIFDFASIPQARADYNELVRNIIDFVFVVSEPKNVMFQELPNCIISLTIVAPSLLSLIVRDNPQLRAFCLYASKLENFSVIENPELSMIGGSVYTPELLGFRIGSNPKFKKIAELHAPKLRGCHIRGNHPELPLNSAAVMAFQQALAARDGQLEGAARAEPAAEYK